MALARVQGLDFFKWRHEGSSQNGLSVPHDMKEALQSLEFAD